MIDIHPSPHAAHSWRDFFIHIATIVIGLLIAIGLEQSVEKLHHRHELAETRGALRQEYEQNLFAVRANTVFFRLQQAEFQNNFLVLSFLQKHPGTRQSKLPGVLRWETHYAPIDHSAWQTAQQTGVTALMSRSEVAERTSAHQFLDKISAVGAELWLADNHAFTYAMTDADPTHLSSAQVQSELDLVRQAMDANLRFGIEVENLHRAFPAFTTPTSQELDALQHSGQQPKMADLAAAEALTDARLASAEANVAELVRERQAEEKKRK